MNALADLARRLDNLLRLGTIAEVNHAQALCRVKSGGITTGWLPWIERRAGTTRTWSPPTVGEQVIVFSPSGEPAAGVVLAGLYTAAHDQPSGTSNHHVMDFPDGARITYDHAAGALAVTGIKTATVQASDHVTVDCPESTITGNVLIQGQCTVQGLLTYANGLAGTGGSNGNAISGDFTHNGGNLSSNGVVLHTHVHGGVVAGGANTEGPQ